MLLYLDLNCFNRPFDDQSQDRIAQETEAIFWILQRIVKGTDQLAWSAALDFENSQHPLADRRDEIARWAHRAAFRITVSEPVAQRAAQLVQRGLAVIDSVHAACAESANCDFFLTCDDRLARRARNLELYFALNPLEYREAVCNA